MKIATISLGSNSDPLDADTDRDGLTDGEEAAIGTSPIYVDTDRDGLPDGWELSHGLDPLDATGVNGASGDPDGDGLSNAGEYAAGSNPGNPDSDGDGLSDGAEVGQGSDPNDPADTLPVTWVSVTGDYPEDEPKTTNATAVVKAGSIAFIGVFLHSEEYPNYTQDASEYNDRLSWSVSTGSVTVLEGWVDVNSCHGAFAQSEANFIGDNAPTILYGGKFIVASANADVSVEVHLAAINISDGELPSTVTLGVFPLRLAQDNMPQATGVASTTDGGTAYTRKRIPAGGVAYITGQPAAPRLTAQFSGMPEWVRVDWNGSLQTERSERFTLDDRMYPVVGLGAAEAYDIGTAMGEIIGGRYGLTSRVWSLDFAETNSVTLFIRGKNPLDVDAKAYIDSQVDAEFAEYAWMIAKHESKSGSRVYNQFNPADPLKELPNKTAGQNQWGWGMGQIDGSNMTSSVVWDWHRNVGAMNEILIAKRRRYNEIVGMYRDAYQNDASTLWREPDDVSTNLNGIVISGRQWAIMTLYNGAGGTRPLPFEGHLDESTPIHFDPATTNWVLFTNSNDYVPAVFRDSGITEVE